jgi:hypothetical protein
VLDLAAAVTPDIAPDHLVPDEAPAEPIDGPVEEPAEEPVMAAAMEPAPDMSVAPMESSDRAMLARQLRSMPRGGLGPRRDRAEMLARRIDALLERMSEASGAGRW